MITPIKRMIKVLEDIADKELNEDKKLAYEYCVYLANTYLEDEKDEIIDAYETSHISMMTAEQYYNETFNSE